MDHREERHGNSQMWNRASTGGQPSLRPPEPNGLKPLAPLRAMPTAAKPGASPAEPAPAPVWQPAAYPTPAAYSDAGQPAPAPAWQPAPPRQQTPPPAWPEARPEARPEPTQPAAPAWQPAAYPTPAAAPDAGQTAAPAWPSAPVRPQTPPAWVAPQPPRQPPAYPPAEAPAQPVRRVWNQTVPQGSSQAQRYETPLREFSAAAPATAFPPMQADASYGEFARHRRSSLHPEPTAAFPGPLAPAAPNQSEHFSAAQEDFSVADEPAWYERPDAEPETPDTRFAPPPVAPGVSPSPARAYAPIAEPSFSGADRTPARNPRGQDALEDDSGRFEPLAGVPLADPVPVPTLEPRRAPSRHKRRHRALPIVLAVALGVVGAAAGLYYTGLWDRLVKAVNTSPLISEGIPAIFSTNRTEATDASATIAPATQTAAAELRSASVTPATATAPATLEFSVETNAATSSLRLLTENGDSLHITAYGTPRGDGLLWQITADFKQPYTGKVRFFLRDQAGKWAESADTCEVTVQ